MEWNISPALHALCVVLFSEAAGRACDPAPEPGFRPAASCLVAAPTIYLRLRLPDPVTYTGSCTVSSPCWVLFVWFSCLLPVAVLCYIPSPSA
ncbi:hypothetical protein NDU88_006095 [Pleurodeles waltl]|uniref:Secreted protein n=1 Tax=Pleurodeles waltl TaxID=8319 RepID=A0AAV7VKY4_PLEWA|nr:hypothetical protein NDU88_006095 [Pleurodeles waltl]